MLEIVHDLAPKAALGFATVGTTPEEIVAATSARCASDAGCDILVDDVLFFNESPFQDGPIAQAANDVTADGALYFSSAGNEGNTLDGTSGNFEADFTDSGSGVGKFAGTADDFDPGPGRAALRAAVRLVHEAAGDAVLGRPARRRQRRLRPLPLRLERRPRSASPRTCRTATTTPTSGSTCRSTLRMQIAVVKFKGASSTSSCPRCAGATRTRRTA